jgi:hypothetical protein
MELSLSSLIVRSSVILLVPLFTTTTHVSAATEHLNINQQAVDTTFDNDIDENDLVMSAVQYDNLVDSIKRGKTEQLKLTKKFTFITLVLVE